jgi:glycosyltransferase involved in cell wall biosynthesis
MALRLTGTKLQPDASSAPSRAAARSADTLALQARGLLINGDLVAYARLFGVAAENEDPQRRYQAQVALVEQALASTAHCGDALSTRILAAAAEHALRALETEPSEPVLLNYAGIACYELWALDAAHVLFRAARHLDPALPNIDRNLDEVGRRRRAQGARTRPLHASVPGLVRRARLIAARAQPTAGLTISLCMIVRDEEQMLPQCLAAAAPAVDEIVIVDTGSTDATIEIARSFGARVIEFPWTGSFSEARNVSFEAATSDWIIYLDADEVLSPEDAPKLRALTGHTWREGMYLVETSYVGELGEGAAVVNNALRVFRNRPGYRFDGRLHEQIIKTLPTFAPGRLAQTAVRIQHYGYLGAVREAKEKSARNVELLLAQAQEGAATPFYHFNLGSEYAAAGEGRAAVTELRTAWKMLNEDGTIRACEYAPTLISRIVNTLRLCGNMTEASAAADEGLELFPDLTDLVLGKARIAQAQGLDADAVALYHRCIDLGDAPARYGPMVGCGTFLPRVALAEHHLTQDEPSAARRLLEWCVEHHPEYIAVAGPYATALVRDGVPADAVSAALAGLDAITPRVRLAVAAALQSAGAGQQAEEQYRLALSTAPNTVRARIALAELLLGRGAWGEAAEQAALVPDDDPYAGLARRITLIGLVGRAPEADVTAALDRGGRVGLPAAEREVFAAWAAIAAGAPVPDGLPIAGAPMLAVILQTLLRSADGERFTALLPALRRSRLPEREQQELVATMLFENGLVGAAAQEWMTACAQRPDARGLLGLARVAFDSGMLDDAVNFASGALELDPGCSPARELLERLPAVAPA